MHRSFIPVIRPAFYEDISQRDVWSVADAFRTLCEPTGGKEGYDSLEVNPHLAVDTDGTLVKVHRLRAVLDRLKAFIKVPVTAFVPKASESCGDLANGALP